MKKDIITVSTVTFNATWGDKAKNLNRIKGYIEAAAKKGSDFVVFPEMALTGYDDEEEKPKAEKMQSKEAELIPGPSSLEVGELTKKLGIYAVFGMPERDPDDPSVIYNALAICGPEGLIRSYRKMHLPYPEPHWATRGDKPCVIDTEWGPIGISICYDSYCFPEKVPECTSTAPHLQNATALHWVLPHWKHMSLPIRCISSPPTLAAKISTTSSGVEAASWGQAVTSGKFITMPVTNLPTRLPSNATCILQPLTSHLQDATSSAQIH